MFKATPRAVHLDFHTSPKIPEIGSRFSEENFIHALEIGHLTSITVFAKCHHGMCYYPTKVGIMHPHLDFDMTGAMIQAAHKVGVLAPVYITAGFSAEDAINHPEWCVICKDGSVSGSRINQESHDPNEARPFCDWTHLCLNDGPYCEHIYAITEEVCQRYKDLDGLFYDIIFADETCYCENCLKGMKEMGLDPEKESDAKYYNIEKRKVFMQKCVDILKKYHPDASIFFNGGADISCTYPHAYQSHFEMEDLPTSWGGYDKMPMRASYFAEQEKSVIGMTGKFHTNWGEFGGYKTPEALKFEVASMMAYGVGCSVGDQMPPDGEMDLATYQMIGEAYAYSEALEPYCLDSKQTAKVGVYLSPDGQSNEGVAKILLENQVDFGVVLGRKFDTYDTVILPEVGALDEETLDALKLFLQKGGKVLATGNSLVKDGQFQIDVGATYDGDPLYDIDYVTITDTEKSNVPGAKILCYGAATNFTVTDGTVLATKTNPYFSRTVGAYCSHQNTPFCRADGNHPAGVQKGNVVYLGHSLCSMYNQYGAVYHRRYFIYALNALNPMVTFRTQMPSLGRASLRKKNDTLVLNLLYGVPAQRGCVSVMEDMPPLYNVPVTIYTEKTVESVTEPLCGLTIPFQTEKGSITFTVPKVEGHTLVVLKTK